MPTSTRATARSATENDRPVAPARTPAPSIGDTVADCNADAAEHDDASHDCTCHWNTCPIRARIGNRKDAVAPDDTTFCATADPSARSHVVDPTERAKNFAVT